MLFFKGIIIGIGKIIPGVSGSMLAISMGIYEKLINSVNNFFENIKYNTKFLLKVGSGIIMSIILFSNLILNCLNKNYLITMSLFIGLIVGSIKDIKLNVSKINNKFLFLSFFLTIIFGLFTINNTSNLVIKNSYMHFIYFLFIGFIDALTMVIPGISGTATLMMLGVYNNIITVFSNIFNINLLQESLMVLIPFIIGIILGILFSVKLVSYLFKKHNDNTYSCILGFTFSTIVLMCIKILKTNYTFIRFILGIFTFIIGFIISKKINHKITYD